MEGRVQSWVVGCMTPGFESGLQSLLGFSVLGLSSEVVEFPGIHVALLVVIELERIAGGNVEFADYPGPIAGALENVGQCGIVQVGVQGRARGGESVLTILVRVESGEHGAARRTTGGLRDVGNIELDPTGGEGVEMGRFENGVAVATKLEAEVIGGDEQYIGLLLFFSAGHALHQQNSCDDCRQNIHVNCPRRNPNQTSQS